MFHVRYLQCQVNVITNKYATYTEKILKSLTAKRLLRVIWPLYCHTADY